MRGLQQLLAVSNRRGIPAHARTIMVSLVVGCLVLSATAVATIPAATGPGVQTQPSDHDAVAPSAVSPTTAAQGTEITSWNYTANKAVAIDGETNTAYVISDGTILVIDLVNKETINSFPAPDGSQKGLAYGSGSLWYADGAGDPFDGQILELDPETGDVRSQINTGYDPYGLAYGDGSVWAGEVTGVPNTIPRFSPDGEQLSRADIEGPAGSDGPAGLAYYNGSIYVGTNNGLYKLDTNGNLQETVNEGRGYKGLAGTDTALYGPDENGHLTVLRGTGPMADDSDGSEGSTGNFSVVANGTTVQPNSTATVEFTLTNLKDEKLPGPAIQLDDQPANFSVVDRTDDGATYKDDSQTWLWLNVPAGESKTPSMTFQVPNGTEPGNYTVTATGTGPSGDTKTVTATIKVSKDKPKSINEAIAGEDGTIGLRELQNAIRTWANNEPVPGTEGKKIGLRKIQELIRMWANGG